MRKFSLLDRRRFLPTLAGLIGYPYAAIACRDYGFFDPLRIGLIGTSAWRLDPARVPQGDLAAPIAYNIFPSLVDVTAFGAKYTVEPWLAREWNIRQDQFPRTLEVQIATDRTWANGSPVTADDVIASVERQLATSANFTTALQDHVTGIERINEDTVVYVLKDREYWWNSADEAAKEILAGFRGTVISRDLARNHALENDDFPIREFGGANATYLGPIIQPDERFLLECLSWPGHNESAIDRVEFLPLPNPEVALYMLMAGEVHLAGPLPGGVASEGLRAAIVANPGLRMAVKEICSNYCMAVNFRRRPDENETKQIRKQSAEAARRMDVAQVGLLSRPAGLLPKAMTGAREPDRPGHGPPLSMEDRSVLDAMEPVVIAHMGGRETDSLLAQDFANGLNAVGMTATLLPLSVNDFFRAATAPADPGNDFDLVIRRFGAESAGLHQLTARMSGIFPDGGDEVVRNIRAAESPEDARRVDIEQFGSDTANLIPLADLQVAYGHDPAITPDDAIRPDGTIGRVGLIRIEA